MDIIVNIRKMCKFAYVYVSYLGVAVSLYTNRNLIMNIS